MEDLDLNIEVGRSPETRGLTEDRDFYELMQTYRHMPIGEFVQVREAYDAVITYLDAKKQYWIDRTVEWRDAYIKRGDRLIVAEQRIENLRKVLSRIAFQDPTEPSRRIGTLPATIAKRGLLADGELAVKGSADAGS